MKSEWIEVTSRFCGPPRSGNGGYVCGRIAKHLTGPTSVRLRAPPPLNKRLRLDSGDGQAALFDGEVVVGEAKSATLDLEPPSPVGYDEARDASTGFVGFKHHQFPGCFVCGPDRTPGDGLRIFPGKTNTSGLVAAPWIPHASLAEDAGIVGSEFLWAALDCTGGFGVLPIPEGIGIVLGELTVRVLQRVRANQPYVVAGWPMGVQGKKRFAGSVIFGDDGSTVAIARATWIDIPLSAWA